MKQKKKKKNEKKKKREGYIQVKANWKVAYIYKSFHSVKNSVLSGLLKVVDGSAMNTVRVLYIKLRIMANGEWARKWNLPL